LLQIADFSGVGASGQSSAPGRDEIVRAFGGFPEVSPIWFNFVPDLCLFFEVTEKSGIG
jgi:hypothetical protein